MDDKKREFFGPADAPGASLLQVTYGERMTKCSESFFEFDQYGEPDAELHMEYNFWVMQSEGRIIVLDTGYDIGKKDWLGEISTLPTPQGLELIGVDPDEVALVITSHFHYDHIGYLHLFKNAEVVAAQKEYDHWIGKLHTTGLDGEYVVAEDLAAVEKAESEGRLRLVEGRQEIQPGISVYPIGGHCPGQLLTLVDTKSGPRILTSDGAHFYEQIEKQWPFFAFTDLEETRAGLAFINELAAEKGAIPIPGHDARVRDRFTVAPGDAGKYVTFLG